VTGDEAIAFHEAAIRHHEAELAKLRAVPAAPVTPQAATRRQPIAKRRWELAARAFRRFPFEEHTVRRICALHPEWAAKLTGSVWHVDADKFDEFAARVERGEASFAVSALSAKSVATEMQLMFSCAGSNSTSGETEDR
jgi:hypothetical protein